MNSLKVLIIDYKIGNHRSVFHALKSLGCDCTVSQNPHDADVADAYVLPGVGAFSEGIKNLKEMHWIESLTINVRERKKPLLGICLGMQLLADESYEYGRHPGLGWIPGRIVKIEAHSNIRLPHVGWNNLQLKKKSPLFLRTDVDTNFYFDHSFHYQCDNEFVAATCLYPEEMIVAVQLQNILGVQFHPEKSQAGGLKVLRCFLNFAANKEIEVC
jgi:imidazole glycerol-phosphate synthase subunit HisH